MTCSLLLEPAYFSLPRFAYILFLPRFAEILSIKISIKPMFDVNRLIIELSKSLQMEEVLSIPIHDIIEIVPGTSLKTIKAYEKKILEALDYEVS